MIRTLLGLMAVTMMVLPATGQAQPAQGSICGNPFVNHFGPWDYTTARREDIELVERFHFTPGVESMTRPATTTFGTMAADVAYILQVFPNHHRALLTMQRLAQRHKADPPPGSQLSVECWFDRALRFRPEDTVSRALYARYLASKGRKPEAKLQIDEAVRHAGDDPLSNFNLGMVYFELGAFEEALAQAHKAAEFGYVRTELVDQLKSVGKWRERADSAVQEK